MPESEFRAFAIAGRMIGAGLPCYVIAEAGVNHDGSLDKALRLIDAAVDAGADAVKFQSFHTDQLVASATPRPDYQVRNTASDEPWDAMLAALQLSVEDHHTLMTHADKRGITFLSSPFDTASLAMLVEMNIAAIKLGSGEITHRPLLEQAARTGKPVILSTGMADESETLAAVDVLREGGAVDIALLHCVSCYPCPTDQANLASIAHMIARFDCPIGYSDHTLGDEAASAAVAMGACIIEKHLTLDPQSPGPDHAASANPHDFAHMVRRLRTIEQMFGRLEIAMQPCETQTRRLARRAVYLRHAKTAGAVLSESDLIALRPDQGIGAMHWHQVIGRTLCHDCPAQHALQWDDLHDTRESRA